MIEKPKCWDCGEQLIWGGDHDPEYDLDQWLIVSNFTCPNCQAFYLKYWGEAWGEDDAEKS